MKDHGQGNLDDDAWSFCQSRIRKDVLETISWILSGWTVTSPETDALMAEMVAKFIDRHGLDMTDEYPQNQ